MLSRGHRSPLTAASPAEPPIEGPCPDAVEDISHLLADVARFAEGLEKLKECVLHDGESQQGHGGLGRRQSQNTDIPNPVESRQGGGRDLGRLRRGLQGGLH